MRYKALLACLLFRCYFKQELRDKFNFAYLFTYSLMAKIRRREIVIIFINIIHIHIYILHVGLILNVKCITNQQFLYTQSGKFYLSL